MNRNPLSLKIADVESKITKITNCSSDELCAMRSMIRSKIPHADQQLDRVLYIVQQIYSRTWQYGETVESATTNVLNTV